MLLDLARRTIGFSPRSPVRFHGKLTKRLLRLSGPDFFRVQDSFEGVQIFGGTGSGKTSGSGQALAMAYLRAGYGGMILCAKPGEAATWIKYARKAGRAAHVVHFHPDGDAGFNFLDYEVHRPDGAGADTFNLVNLMLKVIEAAQLAEGPGGGQGDNPFWTRSLREMLANTVEPLFAATGTLRIDDMMRYITSAPMSPDQFRSEEWRAHSYFYQVLKQSVDAPRGRVLPIHAIKTTATYWFKTYAELDPKTRSNISATLTGTLAPFMRGMLRERFCTTTSIIPEITHEGALLIVDFPIKVWGDGAIVAANIMKYQWQRSTERRLVGKDTRPVFLWADECQFFLSDYDGEFQSTARSAMAATVYITQNLPTYYSRLKSRDPKAAADALLGNFQTKIFHANTEPATNLFAADLIGKDIQRRYSANWGSSSSRSDGESWSSNWSRQSGESEGTNWGGNSSSGGSFSSQGSSSSYSGGRSWGRNRGTSRSRSLGGGYSTNAGTNLGSSSGGGWSEQVDHVIQPRAFAAELRKGGPADRRLVDGIIVQGGRRFAMTGAHWLPCTFKQ